MRLWSNGGCVKPAAVFGLCLAALSLAQPAMARTERYHHRITHLRYRVPATEIPAPSAGFGPTSMGVSSIVIDAATGRVLEASGADVPRYPASLTKLMTLDLAFQALRAGKMTLDTQIPISAHAASVEPVKLGLAPGETITVRQAILAMTTMSANDAATALGEYLGGGSEERGAQMMTLRAHALGMAQTEFYNASGLPNPNQVTTARDLSILARDLVMNFPEDQQFFEARSFNFGRRTIPNIDGMLKLYPGATGMKTGYTDLARHNVVTSAVRDGRVLIGVTLHEPSWGVGYQHMTAMLNAGFGGVTGAPEVDLAANQTPPAAAAVAPPMAAARVETVASRAHHPARELALASREKSDEGRSWTAQLGLYARMSKARVEAVAVQEMRGVGIPRIARIERHGRVLWTAQLAGLTLADAHETCNVLAARGDSCLVIAPSTDHLAMLLSNDGT
jgi:D-alanyl-D-alanine carboxypeptidase